MQKQSLSIDELLTLSEQGNPDAQNDLGIAFMTGSDVVKDVERAVEFFKKAAIQGHTAANANLGVCYADGIGVGKDMKTAVQLFTVVFSQARPNEVNLQPYFAEKIDVVALSELAEQGNAQAQFFLGMCYADGYQVAQNKVKAWELYVKSAKKGEPLSICMIGVYYAEGIGVDRHLFHAEKLLRSIEHTSIVAWRYAKIVRERIINSTPYLLVKVTDKKWAESLLDGDIFMKSLICFARQTKTSPDANNTFRGDILEGFSQSFDDGYNHYGYVTDKDGNVIPDGTVGVVDALTLYKKVFCLYSLEYDNVNSCFIAPDSQLRNFGDTAVVITNAEEFLRRVNTALVAKYDHSFWWSCKRVLYNVEILSNFKYNEFCKSQSYTWQNEFRIALDLSEGKFHPEVLEETTDYAKFTFKGREIIEDMREDSIKDSLIISIGDIRDICISMPVSELLNLENDVFKDSHIIPYMVTKYDHKQEQRPTFIRRVGIFPINGSLRLAFTKNWLDSTIM